MKRTTTLAILCAAMLLVTIGAAAKFQAAAPHPIFSGLVVGERISVMEGRQGWDVRNYNGTQTLEALGPDYLSFSDRGKHYAIYVSQIHVVETRGVPTP
ncbi:MAG: hypothetical protein KDA63_12185 [Planctomycetales bacterium]|nr:hypothetical protein [Planctomycetales bacterium]